jgi:hypothetical protein
MQRRTSPLPNRSISVHKVKTCLARFNDGSRRGKRIGRARVGQNSEASAIGRRKYRIHATRKRHESSRRRSGFVAVQREHSKLRIIVNPVRSIERRVCSRRRRSQETRRSKPRRKLKLYRRRSIAMDEPELTGRRTRLRSEAHTVKDRRTIGRHSDRRRAPRHSPVMRSERMRRRTLCENGNQRKS